MSTRCHLLRYLRDYCLSLGLVWTITSVLDFAYYVLLNVAGARMAMRTRRKLFHSVLRQVRHASRMEPSERGLCFRRSTYCGNQSL